MIYSYLFEKCITVVLLHEGGYVNNLSDYGGETKYGIAKRFFPDEDIKNLTIERAKELYYIHYWQPMKLDGIVDPLAVLHIFDMGVNAGKVNAIRMAQRVAGTKPDGVIGSITKSAINSMADFVMKYKQARVEYYMRIAVRRNNKIFLKGWLNRVSKTNFLI